MSPKKPPSSGENRVVLLVDDHSDHRYALATTLRHAGYTVAEADTGTAALKLCQKASPGLVLLDVRLPDLNGLKVCRLLKQNPITQAIPVIFYSAFDSASPTGIEADALGASAFLTYPVSDRHLFAVIERHLPA